MNEVSAPADDGVPLESSFWKYGVSAVSAYLLALLFIVAGVWKITDPLAAATRMAQALVPQVLSLPAALGFGISETVAGVLLFVPRFRRWGAWLAGLLLVAFMLYIGVFYGALRGADCNCFPWVKRAVGPAFFIGDAIMLLLAVAAGFWARPSHGLRNAALVLGAVGVFAAVSAGVVFGRSILATAPEFVTVDNQPFPLRQGRVFVFFFNPECLHCDAAAKELAKLDWGETRILGVPTQLPQFGQEFLSSNRLRGAVTADVDVLKKTFSFVDVPYAVGLENGRQRFALSSFEPSATTAALKKLGFVR